MIKELQRAVAIVGSARKLARQLKCSNALLFRWKRVPEWALDMIEQAQRNALRMKARELARIKPVTRMQLRPDLFHPNGRRKRRK